MADCVAIFSVLASLTVAAWAANVPSSTCESLKAPINGLVQCSINGTVLTCTGICNNGYMFSSGHDFITRTCEAGTWKGGSDLPLCSPDSCGRKLLSGVNNSDFTASSVWTGVVGYYFGAERARLDSDVVMIGNIAQSGGWRAADNTLDQYIQVKLPEVKRITGITTKGRTVLTGDPSNEYVTQYRVLYSMDGKSWTPYSSQTVGDAFLSGNIDNNTPKTNILSCPFDARYVRINPIAWHENIALRFEILGCKSDGTKPTCSTPTQPPPVTMEMTPTMIPSPTVQSILNYKHVSFLFTFLISIGEQKDAR
ncbi:lactadherin-like [Ruditapes philippinarum]|uniref:lactadherin-like n=1 Tax=Ruditapes philippinarum TaxID=129788 RepID=UPI00295C3300|nr:lactadherin-like [Ruditapes philippinarum]